MSCNYCCTNQIYNWSTSRITIDFGYTMYLIIYSWASSGGDFKYVASTVHCLWVRLKISLLQRNYGWWSDILFRYYGIGNVGHEAIKNFKVNYNCDSICKLARYVHMEIITVLQSSCMFNVRCITILLQNY